MAATAAWASKSPCRAKPPRFSKAPAETTPPRLQQLRQARLKPRRARCLQGRRQSVRLSGNRRLYRPSRFPPFVGRGVCAFGPADGFPPGTALFPGMAAPPGFTGECGVSMRLCAARCPGAVPTLPGKGGFSDCPPCAAGEAWVSCRAGRDSRCPAGVPEGRVRSCRAEETAPCAPAGRSPPVAVVCGAAVWVTLLWVRSVARVWVFTVSDAAGFAGGGTAVNRVETAPADLVISPGLSGCPELRGCCAALPGRIVPGPCAPPGTIPAVPGAPGFPSALVDDAAAPIPAMPEAFPTPDDAARKAAPAIPAVPATKVRRVPPL